MTVVSLAVFFVGLVAWRVPVDGYLAVSEVGQRLLVRSARESRVDETTSPSWDSQQFSALHQALADAIRFADARLASSEPDLSVEVSDERIRHTHSRLIIDTHAVDECDHRIRIAFTGSDPAWSLALVEHLTRDCLLAANAAVDPGTRSARALRDARWRLDQSRHYERKARYGVEDLMDMCFARFSASATDGQDNERAVDSGLRGLGTSPPADDTSVAEINPQWQQLEMQLAQLAEQLRPLVRHLTPNHPHIVDLSQRMEAVRAQLAATPQFLGAQASQALGSTGTPDETAAAQASHVANVVEACADDYQELRKAYEDAIGNREEAERRLTNLLIRPAADADQRHNESRWLITPPTLQGRVGGRPSAGRVGVIGCLALLCGACVAWSIGTLGGLRRINTLDDLEQVLAVPVVGQLSIDPAPKSMTRLVCRSRVLRGVVAAAEITLGLMLVVFLGGAIENSSVSQLLREDPFTAIPETVTHAVQQWF